MSRNFEKFKKKLQKCYNNIKITFDLDLNKRIHSCFKKIISNKRLSLNSILVLAKFIELFS